MSPFLPHSDAPVNGAYQATTTTIALPRSGSGNGAVRIAWSSGTLGYIRFVSGAQGTVSNTTGILLPSSAGVEIMRVPSDATHIAYMGCSLNLVAGDGV